MKGTNARQFTPAIMASMEERAPADHFYRHLERTLDLTCVGETGAGTG